MFFGPAVNAARGISFQINNAVNNFTTNFFVSVRPQIVKSYAQGDNEYLLKLFYNSSKYSFFLLWTLCLPIMLCIDRILDLWLKEVPEYTNVFTIWILSYSLINVLNNPIWSIALAVGKLKKYVMIGSGIFLMVFPLSYIFLKCGASPICVYIVLFCVRICYLIAVLKIIKSYINYSYEEYFKHVIKPILKVLILSLALSYSIKYFIPNTIILMFIFILISISATGITVWLVGMTNQEHKIIKETISNKIKRHEHKKQN